MRVYIYALLSAVLVSILFGTGWYMLFSYDPYRSAFENLFSIYQMQSFWIGVAIWSTLYALFFSLPIAFLMRRTQRFRSGQGSQN